MAIVVRFNTLILRKSWLQEQFPGSLTAYRARHLPQHANFYIEDDRLVAHQSMVDLDREVELLRSAGMDLADSSSTMNWCLTHQEDTRLPESCWLEVHVVNGLFVCWCKGAPSWFICDFTSRRFVTRVAETLCENCRTPLGLEAAARAVDLVEYQNGPLSRACLDPSSDVDQYCVHCLTCGCHVIFCDYGRSVER